MIKIGKLLSTLAASLGIQTHPAYANLNSKSRIKAKGKNSKSHARQQREAKKARNIKKRGKK